MRVIPIIVMSLILTGNVFAFDRSLIPPDWVSIKSKHFEIFYPPQESSSQSSMILNQAERYYNTIADRIGYARYQSFWTWDERVKILFFSDQASYLQATRQPSWSKGFSVSHLSGVNFRMIVSYRGQENFLEAVLPHEISHLILHDFIGAGHKIPVWFDEGIAQLDEPRDDVQNKAILARLIRQNKIIPLSLLDNFPIKQSKDPLQVQIFYVESLYIIDFLIKTYGNDKFARLCRKLRDGEKVFEGIKSIAYPSVQTVEDLQLKWFKYMLEP